MFTIMEINRDYDNEVMDQEDFDDYVEAYKEAKQNCMGPWCIVDRDCGMIKSVGKGFKNRDYGRVKAYFAWGSCNDSDFAGSPEFDQYDNEDFDMFWKSDDLLKYDSVSESEKLNENTKVTLTIGQLKQLVKESVGSGQGDKDVERVGELLGDLYRTAAGEGDLSYTKRLQCAERLKKIIQITDLTLIKSMSDPVDPRLDAAYRAVDALIEELRA